MFDDVTKKLFCDGNSQEPKIAYPLTHVSPIDADRDMRLAYFFWIKQLAPWFVDVKNQIVVIVPLHQIVDFILIWIAINVCNPSDDGVVVDIQ